MGLYTGNGDGGMTSLLNTKNISKGDDRIELLGTIDELNSHIGVVKSHEKSSRLTENYNRIQKNLMKLMAAVADPFQKDYKLSADEVKFLESEIDYFEGLFARKKDFILPGETERSAELDVTRTVARRAERRMIVAAKKFGGDMTARQYLNRLADYFYIMARYQDYLGGIPGGGRTRHEYDDSGRRAADVEQTIVNAVLNQLTIPHSINLEQAKRLIERLEEHCREIGLDAVLCVCGPEGTVKAVHCMDNAFLVSFDAALKKAYTAVAVKMPTLELNKIAQPGGTFYGVDKMDNGKITLIGGGIPLKLDGCLIGGLGVSGGTGEQDHAVAEFGLHILSEIL
ncbi:MAG: cob(I)yrinic acid a,c-diamide adenosyltransferase [Lachnospiraceae bacterium]|nr:cob(I)yrinic acid a,c-diamide adenosyltransferase [Lachnospiraceae bacterium]MDY5742148.1 cob(I)yrinic acid a,c-diamide adenosyltransferase [Lachnospiraceae bacterium]